MADKLYRLLTGRHTRVEGDEKVTYQAGKRGSDLIRLSDDKAERMGLGTRVQLVGSEEAEMMTTSGSGSGSSSGEAGKSSGWGVVLNQTVPDVVDSLGEIDSLDDLHAIQKQEEEGAARKGVLKAIDERIEELQNAG